MAELDDFRPRIINWSRVYRDRLVRQESNIAPLLRTLRLLNKKKTRDCDDEEQPAVPMDQEDADLLDQCWKKLSRQQQKILKVAYLTRYDSDTYESSEDMYSADKRRANYVRMYVSSYLHALKEAETALMRAVQSVEAAKSLEIK